MVYVKKADREKFELNRKSPILKTADIRSSAAHCADKISRTFQKAHFILEQMRSKNISEKEKRMLQVKFQMYKKRINRRLSKLTVWTDTNPEERLLDLRPSSIYKIDNKTAIKNMQAYIHESTIRHKEMEQQKQSSNQQHTNTSLQQPENQPQFQSTVISSSSGSGISSHSNNIAQLVQQQKLLYQQQQLMQIQQQYQHKNQQESSTTAIQSPNSKLQEGEDNSSYNIKSLMDEQQLNNINLLKSLKEDL